VLARSCDAADVGGCVDCGAADVPVLPITPHVGYVDQQPMFFRFARMAHISHVTFLSHTSQCHDAQAVKLAISRNRQA